MTTPQGSHPLVRRSSQETERQRADSSAPQPVNIHMTTRSSTLTDKLMASYRFVLQQNAMHTLLFIHYRNKVKSILKSLVLLLHLYTHHNI